MHFFPSLHLYLTLSPHINFLICFLMFLYLLDPLTCSFFPPSPHPYPSLSTLFPHIVPVCFQGLPFPSSFSPVFFILISLLSSSLLSLTLSCLFFLSALFPGFPVFYISHPLPFTCQYPPQTVNRQFQSFPKPLFPSLKRTLRVSSVIP